MICDKNKLTEKGCNGAPNWIIEITSPTNPQKNTVMVYDFEREDRSNQYNFEEDIPVCIYEDFHINIANLLSTE